MSTLSESTLVTLLGVAVALPLVISFIAYAVEEASPGALVPRIAFPLLWLGSVALFVPAAIEGSNRYMTDAGGYYAYWAVGIIALVAAGIWMMDTYGIDMN